MNYWQDYIASLEHAKSLKNKNRSFWLLDIWKNVLQWFQVICLTKPPLSIGIHWSQHASRGLRAFQPRFHLNKADQSYVFSSVSGQHIDLLMGSYTLQVFSTPWAKFTSWTFQKEKKKKKIYLSNTYVSPK